MVGIIVKKYEHFNKSLPNWNTPQGVYVKSKDHYERLCKEAGMVSVDTAGKTSASGPNRKEYSLSQKGAAIIQAAKASNNGNGKVKLSDRTIDAMKSIGAIAKKIPDYMELPSKYGKI